MRYYLTKHPKIAIYILAITILSSCGGDSNNSQTTASSLQKYYIDADGDTFGNPNISKTISAQPTGYVLNNSDCDDNNARNHPNALEVFDGVDNNCNGIIDENFVTYYRDADADGYGDITVSQAATSQPAGFVTDNSDCNDADANINPAAIEIPGDGKDNNCNNQVDETSYYYADADKDTFGDPNISQISISQPTGFVTNSGDCDDTDPNINPNAIEIVGNLIDDNCDGIIL